MTKYTIPTILVYMDQSLYLHILETAIAIIKKQGLQGWNMDSLAYESGITKRTLYSYISSREVLIRKAVQLFLANHKSLLEKITGQADSGKKRSLEIMLKGSYSVIKDIYSFPVPEIIRKYPGLKEELQAVINDVPSPVQKFLLSEQVKGSIRKDLDIQLFIKILTSIIESIGSESTHFSRTDWEQITAIFLKGIQSK